MAAILVRLNPELIRDKVAPRAQFEFLRRSPNPWVTWEWCTDRAAAHVWQDDGPTSGRELATHFKARHRQEEEALRLPWPAFFATCYVAPPEWEYSPDLPPPLHAAAPKAKPAPEATPAPKPATVAVPADQVASTALPEKTSDRRRRPRPEKAKAVTVPRTVPSVGGGARWRTVGERMGIVSPQEAYRETQRRLGEREDREESEGCE
jgi:hypothetical protein